MSTTCVRNTRCYERQAPIDVRTKHRRRREAVVCSSNWFALIKLLAKRSAEQGSGDRGQSRKWPQVDCPAQGSRSAWDWRTRSHKTVRRREHNKTKTQKAPLENNLTTNWVRTWVDWRAQIVHGKSCTWNAQAAVRIWTWPSRCATEARSSWSRTHRLVVPSLLSERYEAIHCRASAKNHASTERDDV